MIMLLALPVLLVVASAHRYLQVYAPSNVVIRRVRISRPTLRSCAGLVVLAAGLLLAMRFTASAVATGAPGWLNLVVLVLAWDALKLLMLAIITACRALTWIVRSGHSGNRSSECATGTSSGPSSTLFA